MNVYLDFEFRNPTNKYEDILCCAWKEEKGPILSEWLEDKDLRRDFAIDMHNYYEEGATFVSYVIQAEARCLFQMWDEFRLPYAFSDFKAIDLYLEWRMLTNHNHELEYGQQYIKGQILQTKPKPLYQRVKDVNDDSHHKAEHSLAACTYKLLGIMIDTEHKNEMRDLIISGKSLTAHEMTQIQEYCGGDIENLSNLFHTTKKHLTKKAKANTTQKKQKLIEEMNVRGNYAARTAKMEMIGYPIITEKLKKFSQEVPSILLDEQEQINSDFQNIAPFEFNAKTGKYVLKQKKVRAWITEQGYNWDVTDKGFVSLSLEAFRRYFSSRSPGFGGAMVAYLNTKQSMNGFLPRGKNSTRKSFWDFVGDDERVRPFYGIYGAQSARSQPAATGFIPLKANWMRAFIMPPSGKAIVGIDYASQEFLLSALMSEDREMINAYLSGDPYLHFAKLDGAVPNDATKETHSHKRNIYKSVTLGISYNMGAKGLAHKLTNDLGEEYTQEQAEELIQSFKSAFPDFAEWQKDLIEDYESAGKHGRVKLPCGWYMWGDNPNWRSVGNVPIQGMGSSIMRKAVCLAQDEGLDVIYTLHDAIYVEYEAFDYSIIDTLYDCMNQAFKFYIAERLQHLAECRMDIFTWSSDYKEDVLETQDKNIFTQSPIYIDERGAKTYNKYSKYFL